MIRATFSYCLLSVPPHPAEAPPAEAQGLLCDVAHSPHRSEAGRRLGSLLLFSGDEDCLLVCLGVLHAFVQKHVTLMIYHSEADVAALYVDAHSGVRSHNVLIELVALTVIVLPEILVSGRMIVTRDVEVNVALLEQRQNEAAQVGLSVELVITLVAHQNGEVADDDAVLGCAELLALDDLFEPFVPHDTCRRRPTRSTRRGHPLCPLRNQA